MIEPWNKSTREAVLWRIQIALQTYMLWNIQTVIVEFIVNLEEEYALQLQRAFYAVSGPVLMPSEAEDGVVTQEALERSDAVHRALCYAVNAVFSTLHSLVGNIYLYRLKGKELPDCPEVKKCQLKT